MIARPISIPSSYTDISATTAHRKLTGCASRSCQSCTDDRRWVGPVSPSSLLSAPMPWSGTRMQEPNAGSNGSYFLRPSTFGDVIARTDSNSTEKNSTPYPALLFTKPLFPQRVMPLPARAGNRCHLTSRECVAVSETTHGAENKVGAPVATDPEAKLSLSHKTGVTPAKPGSQSEYRIVHRPDFYQRDGVETHLNHPACIQTGKVHRSL
jgi:hypothetical protein